MAGINKVDIPNYRLFESLCRAKYPQINSDLITKYAVYHFIGFKVYNERIHKKPLYMLDNPLFYMKKCIDNPKKQHPLQWQKTQSVETKVNQVVSGAPGAPKIMPKKKPWSYEEHYGHPPPPDKPEQIERAEQIKKQAFEPIAKVLNVWAVDLIFRDESFFWNYFGGYYCVLKEHKIVLDGTNKEILKVHLATNETVEIITFEKFYAAVKEAFKKVTIYENNEIRLTGDRGVDWFFMKLVPAVANVTSE